MSTEQSFVEQVNNQSIVEVSRPYVLKKKSSGETFKVEGKDCFSEVTSLAVRVKGGVIATRAAVMPWTVDPEFKEHKDNYEGVSLGLRVKIGDETLVFDSVAATCITPKSEELYFIAIDSNANGLSLNIPSDDIEGWVVLLIKDSDTSWTTIPYRKKLSVRSRTEVYELSRPLGVDQIYGGVFLVPVFTSIGVLEFRFSGMVIDNGEKLSIVVPSQVRTLKKASVDTPTKGLIPVKKEGDGEKKPAKKNKKR